MVYIKPVYIGIKEELITKGVWKGLFKKFAVDKRSNEVLMQLFTGNEETFVLKYGYSTEVYPDMSSWSIEKITKLIELNK